MADTEPAVPVTQEMPPVVTPPADVVVAEAPATEPAEGATEPSVDWKARAEASEAAQRKLENDLRSLRGSRQKQQESANVLEELRVQNRLILEALQSGETEGLATKVAQATSTLKETRDAASFQTQYASSWRQLEKAVTGEDGRPVFDVETARAKLGAEAQGLPDAAVVIMGSPELQAVREAWIQAAPQGERTPVGERDMASLTEAVLMAAQVSRRVENERSQQAIAKAKKDRTQSLDLSSGTPAAGGVTSIGTITEAELRRRMDADPDYWKQHKTEIQAAVREGRIRTE